MLGRRRLCRVNVLVLPCHGDHLISPWHADVYADQNKIWEINRSLIKQYGLRHKGSRTSF